MTKISIELVPHAAEEITSELKGIQEAFPKVNTVNIPDIVRLPTRSWEACGFCATMLDRDIPHLRACDFDLNEPSLIHDIMSNYKFSEVLLVGGDFFEGREHFETSTIDFIKFFKAHYPEVKVYGAIDPYRTDFNSEMAYLKEKIDANIDGFFTQPFFDLELLAKWIEALKGHVVYWGLSPVLSSKSQAYWEKRNLVNFPKDFVPELEWNAQFAADAIELIDRYNSCLYFMPIRIPVVDYLNAIIPKSSILESLLK
ncbi:methylenetetrahydrofolate reductase [Lentisphaera marina]|uniref:methylenetetrahydrofolate reductase n=1 Tax=Lentisphaera marina TaxID=1111041 RepID=UPI002365B260|nr:methylenetetrahydrofolate reductase [Lentisphaera marina]MDD7983698.1 methylenetetrahydrofolate reductase [Lentisphaera marina]